MLKLYFLCVNVLIMSYVEMKMVIILIFWLFYSFYMSTACVSITILCIARASSVISFVSSGCIKIFVGLDLLIGLCLKIFKVKIMIWCLLLLKMVIYLCFSIFTITIAILSTSTRETRSNKLWIANCFCFWVGMLLCDGYRILMNIKCIVWLMKMICLLCVWISWLVKF